MKCPRKLNQAAFTILELMIATAVLSVILLLVTTMMINIGSLFYKGVNQSRVQQDTRTITDQISQDIKLNDATLTSKSEFKFIGGKLVWFNAYCIAGSVRYSYVTGYKLGAAGSKDTDASTPLMPHVLWRDDDSDTKDQVVPFKPGCEPINVSNSDLSFDKSGTELIAPNSRLTAFSVNQAAVAGAYDVQVGVAYGDIDLLTNPGSFDAACKGNVGDQFCATSALQTTVSQRLPGN